MRNRIKFTKDDFVAGNITVMHNVFKQLGVEIPETHDYPDVQLDLITVDNAIDDYENSGLAPKAYGIDFGVLDTGETVLIEVNEGYSLGNYGLDDKDYTELIETRWNEIIQK